MFIQHARILKYCHLSYDSSDNTFGAFGVALRDSLSKISNAIVT